MATTAFTFAAGSPSIVFEYDGAQYAVTPATVRAALNLPEHAAYITNGDANLRTMMIDLGYYDSLDKLAPENYKSDVVVEESDKVALEALESLAKAGEEPSKSKADDREKSVQDPVEKVANPASDNDEDDDNMSKIDLIDLLVEMNERNNSVNQRTLSRISELNLKHEEEVSSLCEQNNFLKNENNKYKDVVTKLEIENISLVLNTEELENEKLQLNENTRMLHVDLLNLKIQNESLAQGKSNSVVQKDNDELVHALSEKDEIFELETQRLKDEHSKILAQVMDQERILNDKINILSKEKDDLERTIQKFTKGNELLDKMVHSKISYNHEGLGYDKNAQPKKFVQGKKQTTFVPATPKYKCSYCNKDGHTVEYCKIKNGEIKGKYMWVRKGTKTYTKVDRFVPNNYVDGTKRKPKFSYVQKPIAYQNRNSGYNAYTNGQSSRSHFVPSHRFYPQNTMYYSNDRNNRYQGGNYQKPRYYDYSRNNASRNSYVPTHAYTIPSFYKPNVCLVTKRDMWYLDSGCSRHMTGNKSLLNSIRKVTAGSVTFGDSSKGSIIGIGDIGNEH
nr:PREDICTED: uncharacterized protein LOC108204124 [Daucus carota subsp. sativus]